MMTNNVKLSVLSTVPLTKMDHKWEGLVVAVLQGIDMNQFLATCTANVSATEDHLE